MGFQNTINSAIGAVGAAAALGRHISNQNKQNELAKEADRSNINSELSKLDEQERELNSSIEDEMAEDPIVEHTLDTNTGENSVDVVTDKEKYLNSKLDDSKMKYDQVTSSMKYELNNGGMNAQYKKEYKDMTKDAMMYKKAIESYQNKLDMIRKIKSSRDDINSRLEKLNGGK